MQRTWTVIGWLAPVAFMLLLITSSVCLSANSLWLYERLFERNQVPARTGITIEGLRDVSGQIQDYFGSDTEPMQFGPHTRSPVSSQIVLSAAARLMPSASSPSPNREA